MTHALLYWSPQTKLVNYRLVHWNYRRRKNYHLPKWRTSTRQRVKVKFCQIKNIYFLHTCFILLNLNWELILILWALKSKWWIDGDYFVLYCRFMTLVNELFLIIISDPYLHPNPYNILSALNPIKNGFGYEEAIISSDPIRFLPYHASVYIFLFATFVDQCTYHPIVQLNANTTVSSCDSWMRSLQSPFLVSQ